MPSATSSPDSNDPNDRRRALSCPPLSPFTIPVPSPSVPIQTNERFDSASPISENYTFTNPQPDSAFPSASSNPQPVSAFSSTSSSEAGDLPCDGGPVNMNEINQWNFGDLTELDEHGNVIPDGPINLNQECQDIFSLEWGGPVPDLGPYTANVPREQVVPVSQVAEAMRQSSLNNFHSAANGNANATTNGINVNIDGQTWCPSHSMANLPHMQASAGNVAALPPCCSLCMLPMPIAIPPKPNVPIYTINFNNPQHQSIFLLTSPPPPYHMPNHEEGGDAGIYMYLSRADMYLHTHPGPLPRYLPGYATQTRVGRLRGDADEAIWLDTGAGGMGQDWLRAFWDMCRNTTMPKSTPDWWDIFDERDWIASVMETTKRHGIVIA